MKISAEDEAGNQSNTLIDVFADLTQPTIIEFSGLPNTPNYDPVASIEVTFSEKIDLDTFNYEDITLTRDGEILTLDNTVTVEFFGAKSYRILGLDNFTQEIGTYNLRLDATTIEDNAGNIGLSADSVTFNVEGIETTFDIDGDGQYLASVDGLLFYGYLNIRNLPSADLVNNLTQQLDDNLINPQGGETRTTGQAIASYLESNPDMMDIDGDGAISASIDGLLAYGYFNIRNLPSQDLVNNLTQQLANNLIPDGSNADRTSGVAISNFIDSYMV